MRNIPNSPPTLFIGQNYIYLTETQSTNSHLKFLLGEKFEPEGTVVSTGHQTQGRGQAGTKWESSQDQNIMLSVLLYPKFINPLDQFTISKCIALAVFDFISFFLNQYPVKIKWPNDILVSGQKICGILIENGLKGDIIEYSIAGIGININEIFEDKDRTSLKTITRLEYDLKYLERILFTCIEARYLQLRNNAESISNDYLEHLFGYEEVMNFIDLIENQNFTGTIRNINRDGRLIIESGGELKMFNLKEVKIIDNF